VQARNGSFDPQPDKRRAVFRVRRHYRRPSEKRQFSDIIVTSSDLALLEIHLKFRLVKIVSMRWYRNCCFPRKDITLNREANMSLLPNPKGRCILIESMQGGVKLIQRIDKSASGLVTRYFPNLENCLEYVAKNQFQIDTIYSGRRKKARECGKHS
jgi:hypothetical protein